MAPPPGQNLTELGLLSKFVTANTASTSGSGNLTMTEKQLIIDDEGGQRHDASCLITVKHQRRQSPGFFVQIQSRNPNPEPTVASSCSLLKLNEGLESSLPNAFLDQYAPIRIAGNEYTVFLDGFIHSGLLKKTKQNCPSMTHLLETETPFVFSEECIDCLNTLKRKLTEVASDLILPIWDLPFETAYASSDFAIGGRVHGAKKITSILHLYTMLARTMNEAQTTTLLQKRFTCRGISLPKKERRQDSCGGLIASKDLTLDVRDKKRGDIPSRVVPDLQSFPNGPLIRGEGFQAVRTLNKALRGRAPHAFPDFPGLCKTLVLAVFHMSLSTSSAFSLGIQYSKSNR
ncbi:hypothetical protein Tco_1345104 [Tanacetum coccineum]